jgi:threonine dehydrogenase-like Zn-dependent dehydrogenase
VLVADGLALCAVLVRQRRGRSRGRWPGHSASTTEFDDAIALLAGGLDVDPIVTHTFPLDEARAAFALIADRTVASKVLLQMPR